MRCIFSLVLLASTTTSALSAEITREQQNVIQHVATIAIGMKWCTNYQFNETAIIAALSSSKVYLDREPFK